MKRNQTRQNNNHAAKAKAKKAGLRTRIHVCAGCGLAND
jgi:uncharacterized membrane protein YhiD involved in acid resistance